MASTTDKSPAKRAADKAARKAERKLQQQQLLMQQQQQYQQQNNNELDGEKTKHEEQILEAIDQLRRRKARPDADRICNYLLRKFHVDARDTIADLRKLIETEKVIEVDYKGNTSYRNASKWTRLQLYKNRPEGFIKEKINLAMVSNVVGELVIDEPDYLELGVPHQTLVEQLLYGATNPTSRRMVEDYLSKEVMNGNLARLSNGNYSLLHNNTMNSSNVVITQQNGDSIIKNKTSNSISVLKEAKNSFRVNDLEEYDDESGISILKSSRQTSPRDLESMKKDCYEIIVGGRQINEITKDFKDYNDKLTNGCRRDENIKQNGKIIHSFIINKEEQKTITETQTQQKKSKTERKQRLCVRSDDSTDLIFKFEEYGKETSYKDEDKRDDGNDRFSEDEECDQDIGRSSTNPSPTLSHTNKGSFRSARRKRAKKVFDPSDNMVVKRKRGRHSNAAKALINAQESQENTKPIVVKESPKDPQRHCSLCSKDKQEALTACRDCTVRAHPSCIYSPEEIIHKAHTSWQCERCKTCVVCYETSEVGPLVTCYNCDDAYHYSCHTSRIPVTKSKWFCHECGQKQFKPTSQNSNSNWTNNSLEQSSHSTVPTVTSPQVSPKRSIPEHIDDENAQEIDPNIPDATDWTVEQVYQYFARLFPKEAEIFRTHEIDGHALLLLTRKDVLTGFQLLLGPALKIYRHVVKLQMRKDDAKYYWL